MWSVAERSIHKDSKKVRPAIKLLCEDTQLVKIEKNACEIVRLPQPMPNVCLFPLMLPRMRFVLVVLSLALWLGGLTFYAGVVVPVGTQILGSVEQGFVTQKVTNWLNLIGSVVLLVLLWDIRAQRTRIKLAAFILMFCCQAALFLLHPQLDALLDAENRVVSDSVAFYGWHRWYLIVTTVHWAAGAVYLGAMVGPGASQVESTA